MSVFGAVSWRGVHLSRCAVRRGIVAIIDGRTGWAQQALFYLILTAVIGEGRETEIDGDQPGATVGVCTLVGEEVAGAYPTANGNFPVRRFATCTGPARRRCGFGAERIQPTKTSTSTRVARSHDTSSACRTRHHRSKSLP